MKQVAKTTELGNYDADITFIGGLRDCSSIVKAIQAYFSETDSLQALINQRNEFNIRTESTRKLFTRKIKKSFLRFKNTQHEEFIETIFTDAVPQQDKEFAMFWQFALNNRLFREISLQVFANIYYSGRVSINKNDVLAYLKEFIYQNPELQIGWAESTIDMISSKYLNIMTKLNFLTGKRVKSFRHIRPSSEAQVLFLYFAKLFAPNVSNILTNELLKISFISSNDIYEQLKRLSIKGFFNISFNGVVLNVELTHSYKGICDVLYNRSSEKIC